MIILCPTHVKDPGSRIVCFEGLWSTRQMNSTDDREIIVRTTIRELVVYIAFLVVLSLRKLTFYSLHLV